MINALMNYEFMQNAVICCILASIVCGIIGVIIVEKKMVMMCGGIAHTAYGGVGLGYLVGFPPILGAFGFALLAAFGIGKMQKNKTGNLDSFMAMFWSLGMALGIAFVGFMPGYPPDLNSYLFGNVLSVTKSDIIVTLITAIVVVLVVIVLFNDWKSFLFDDEFSSIIGLKTTILNYLMLFLVAMSVVALIRVVGIILVLALITAPATASALISKSLKNRMLISIVLGMIYCFVGLVISYYANIASGATIIAVSVLSYFALKLCIREKE